MGIPLGVHQMAFLFSKLTFLLHGQIVGLYGMISLQKPTLALLRCLQIGYLMMRFSSLENSRVGGINTCMYKTRSKPFLYKS